MRAQSLACPNCGAAYDPAHYRCKCCDSYILISDAKFEDFSHIKFDLPPKPKTEKGKYPGIYVYGRLLGKDERPITLGLANYVTGLLAAGGKLLLTNKSLSFSAHAFNVGEKEVKIALEEITEVKVHANMLVSQKIHVTAGGITHGFVVYHGKEWVEKIQEAITACKKEKQEKTTDSMDYIEELQRLKALLDQGIITEEEFRIKKRMLLGI